MSETALDDVPAEPGQPFVLLVEDYPDDARLISRAFRKLDLDAPVHRVVDGEQAVAALSEAAANSGSMPILVLLDLKLPRRSGFEVLEWMKQHELIRRIPVVVLTSSREHVDLQRAYDLGANSYLVKPVRPGALNSIARLISEYWLSLNERPPFGGEPRLL